MASETVPLSLKQKVLSGQITTTRNSNLVYYVI
jgi:hypothetical protein